MTTAPRHLVHRGTLYRLTPAGYERAFYLLSRGKSPAYALKQAAALAVGTVLDITDWTAYDARTQYNAFFGTSL